MKKITLTDGQYVEYDVVDARPTPMTDRWMRWVNEARGVEPTREWFWRQATGFAAGGVALAVLAYLGFLPWMGMGFSMVVCALVMVLSFVATVANYRWRIREMHRAHQYSYRVIDAAYRDQDDELVHWSGHFAATS